MSWYEYIPAVISAVSALSQNSSANKQNEGQKRINDYNSMQGYQVAMGNIESQSAIAFMNAQSILRNAKEQAELQSLTATHNVAILRSTTAYNDLLFEQEEAQVWESAGLDQKILHMKRARERGAMEAVQSASGTVMGQDSNADVIIDQQTMEAMDAFVINHNADAKAAEIQNAQARNLWDGEMKAQKILWEGQVNNISTLSTAGTQAITGLLSSQISGKAGAISAQYQLTSGLLSGQNNFAGNSTQIQNNFASGMFGAIGSAAKTYGTNSEKDAEKEAGKSLMASGN